MYTKEYYEVMIDVSARMEEVEEAIACESHPFATEIQALYESTPPLYPTTCQLPDVVSDDTLKVVSDKQQLESVAAELAHVDRLAVDMEAHSQHSYAGLSCLIQLSTGQVDYVIDVIALKPHMHLLKPLFENPTILKVLHGSGNDVAWLQRDFGIYLVNIFDTEKACQVLGYQQRSLGYLLQKICNIDTDKSYQQADWRVRPLPADYIHYARTDVHYLLYIADRLADELVQAGGSHMSRAIHRSQSVCLTLYRPPCAETATTNASLTIMKRVINSIRERDGFVGVFSDSETRDLEAIGDCIHVLCRWRDATARRLDDGLQCILPDSIVASIGQNRPVKSVEQFIKAIKQASLDNGNNACCHFPSAIIEEAEQLFELFRDAADGQLPWVHPQIQELIRPQLKAGANGNSMNKRHMDPEEFRAKLADKFAAKKEVYENNMMLSQDGSFLCFTDRKRLEWYVKKGIAHKVSDEPFTIQLNFQHKTSDQDRGEQDFYQVSRINRCVSCGKSDHWLRYRVVPTCYRKALPVAMKSHRSHDIVLLCVSCHELAQGAAKKLKDAISIEYNVPLLPPPPTSSGNGVQEEPDNDDGAVEEDAAVTVNKNRNKILTAAKKAAIAIENAGERLPEARSIELTSYVRLYIKEYEPDFLPEIQLVMQQSDATDNSCTPLCALELYLGLLAGCSPRNRRRILRRWLDQGLDIPQSLLQELNDTDDGDAASTAESHKRYALGHDWHGKEVIRRAMENGGLQEVSVLCRRFRQCFLDSLHPQYMPQGWQVDHFVPREFGEQSTYSSSSTH